MGGLTVEPAHHALATPSRWARGQLLRRYAKSPPTTWPFHSRTPERWSSSRVTGPPPPRPSTSPSPSPRPGPAWAGPDGPVGARRFLSGHDDGAGGLRPPAASLVGRAHPAVPTGTRSRTGRRR